jgi:hypothetical protein
MADESTTDSMAGIGPALVSNFLISEPRDEAVLAPLVHWQDAMGSLSVAQGAITSTLSATAISNGATEADAGSWSQVTTAAATFTPAIKAAFVIVSMQRMRSSPVDIVASVRGIVERGLVNKLEADIGALGGGFSNTAGTSGAALAIAALQNLNDLLIDVISRIQMQNKKNQLFLSRAMQSLNELKDGFTGKKHFTTYGANGMTRSASR